MQKNEKVREHIQIAEKIGVTFGVVIELLVDVFKTILNDELIVFAYINEQGHIVGSDNAISADNFIYDNGTLFRAYTKNMNWRISAVRRKDSGSVTFVELSAPYTDEEKVFEIAEYIIKKTKGTRAVV